MDAADPDIFRTRFGPNPSGNRGSGKRGPIPGTLAPGRMTARSSTNGSKGYRHGIRHPLFRGHGHRGRRHRSTLPGPAHLSRRQELRRARPGNGLRPGPGSAVLFPEARGRAAAERQRFSLPGQEQRRAPRDRAGGGAWARAARISPRATRWTTSTATRPAST